MSETHLDRWYKKRLSETTMRLREEIRPLPTLDPGTDRPDDTEQSVVNASLDVLRILGEPDEVLFPHLDDLRSIARAINQRITSIED